MNERGAAAAVFAGWAHALLVACVAACPGWTPLAEVARSTRDGLFARDGVPLLEAWRLLSGLDLARPSLEVLALGTLGLVPLGMLLVTALRPGEPVRAAAREAVALTPPLALLWGLSALAQAFGVAAVAWLGGAVAPPSSDRRADVVRLSVLASAALVVVATRAVFEIARVKVAEGAPVARALALAASEPWGRGAWFVGVAVRSAGAALLPGLGAALCVAAAPHGLAATALAFAASQALVWSALGLRQRAFATAAQLPAAAPHGDKATSARARSPLP
jgi:hypothetical protein